jgi:hypothetical protein
MVRVTVFRLYSAEEAVLLAEEPSLLSKRIRADRERPPSAVIEVPDSADAAAMVSLLSTAFGVVVMDIEHSDDPLDDAHPLVDQGRAMVREAEKLVARDDT